MPTICEDEVRNYQVGICWGVFDEDPLLVLCPLFILLPFVCCPSRTINDFCNCSARQTATLRQQESCLPMGLLYRDQKLVCAWLREAQSCCWLDILHCHAWVLFSLNILLPTTWCASVCCSQSAWIEKVLVISSQHF